MFPKNHTPTLYFDDMSGIGRSPSANFTFSGSANTGADFRDNDGNVSGKLWLFSPSSTTFVKHFSATMNETHGGDITMHNHVAGYFNTTTAITRFRFKQSSGNIDSGTIEMYGIN